MNILVTGGSGFIGKNIVEQMGQNYNIMAPSHRELDLLDEKSVANFFKNHPFDVVVHSAVKPGHRNAPDLDSLFYSNTRMFFNLIRNSDSFKKIIFLSSGAVYDIRNSLGKVPEEFFDQYVPEDEHGFSKYVCSKYIELADNAIELRLFGVFGKYEDYSIRFISNAICKTLFDMPITIRQNRNFDYLFIDDLIPVLEHFIHADPHHKSYNFTPDKSIELLTVAEIVKHFSGKNLPIIVHNSGLGLEYSGSNNRLYEEISGLKLTPFATAIESLFKWYHERRDLIDQRCLQFDK